MTVAMFLRRWVAGLLGLLMLIAVPVAVQAETPQRWVLEIGPYFGYYDFDRLTSFKDFGYLGARIGVHAAPWLRVEGEFDEVYTTREVSDNRARQITFALHARIEPWASRVAPFLLIGAAVVILDDSDDPDSFGDAYDIGLGARWLWREHWTLRAEWVLRRQPVRLWTRVEDEFGASMLEPESVTLWGRALRMGISHVF